METLRGPQPFVIVSEPGLYSLILRSRKPEAKAFKRWVTTRYSRRSADRFMTGHVPGRVPGARLARGDPAARRGLPRGSQATGDRTAPRRRAGSRCRSVGRARRGRGRLSLRDAGHILNRDPRISIGQNRLMRRLRDLGMVDRRGIPYVRYSRYLVERPIAYSHPHTGEAVLESQIRMTVDGLEYLRKRLGGIGQETT